MAFRPHPGNQEALRGLARSANTERGEMLNFWGFLSGLSPANRYVICGSADAVSEMFGVHSLTDALYVQYRDLGDNSGAYSHKENAIYLSDVLLLREGLVAPVFAHELVHRALKLAGFNPSNEPTAEAKAIATVFHEAMAEFLGLYVTGTFYSAPGNTRRAFEYAACRLIYHAATGETGTFAQDAEYLSDLERHLYASEPELSEYLLAEYRASCSHEEHAAPLPEELHKRAFKVAYALLGVALLSYMDAMPRGELDVRGLAQELLGNGLQRLSEMARSADFDAVAERVRAFGGKAFAGAEF